MFRTFSAGFALWILLSLYALNTSLKSNPQGDEPHYLLMTVSFIRDHDFDLENNFRTRDFEAFTTWNLEPQRVQARNGRLVTAHEPGLPFLCALPYLAGGRTGVTLFLTLLAAVGILLVHKLALLLSRRTSTARIAALVLTVSLPYPLLAGMVFPDVPAAVLIVLALILLLRPETTVTPLAVSATILCVLPFLHTKYTLFSIGLGLLFIILKRPSPRMLPIPFALIAIGAAGYFAVQNWIYGDPLFLFRVRAQGFLNPLDGILGSLWDREAGLLTVAPIFAFALPGFVLVRRDHPALTGVSVPAALFFLMNASWLDWHGGHCPPARYLTPLLPLLAVFTGIACTSSRKRAMPILLLLAAPTLMQTLLLLVRVPESVIVRGDGYRMLWEGLPAWMPHLFPSLLNPDRLPRLHAIGLTVTAILTVLIPFVRGRRTRRILGIAALGGACSILFMSLSDYGYRQRLIRTPLSDRPPALVSPLPDARFDDQFPDLIWSEVTGADGYRWRLIFPDGYQVAAETHRETRLDVPDSFSEAMPEGEYQWLVAPLKNGREGMPSDIRKFRFVRNPSSGQHEVNR